MIDVPIDTLYAGRPRLVAPRIEGEGLVGDRQAGRRHHGGVEKALHHYPREHYDAWRTNFPELSKHWRAPGFGENISTLGLAEDTVCVGDVFALGGVRLQVSQGRQPLPHAQFSLRPARHGAAHAGKQAVRLVLSRSRNR